MSERSAQVESETCKIVKYNRNVDPVTGVTYFQTAWGLRVTPPFTPVIAWHAWNSEHRLINLHSFFFPFSTEGPVFPRDKTLFPHLQKEAQNI